MITRTRAVMGALVLATTAGARSGGTGDGSGSGGSATGAAASRESASQAAAQQQAPSGKTGASQNQVSGRVALVNPSEREIAIDAGTATMQFKVAPDAKITLDGKKASFEDIAKGAEVRASLDRSGGGFQAKQIEVTSTAKK
jgi:Cu/Ag efflux protein CusF